MNKHLRRLEKLEAATSVGIITAITGDGAQFRLRRDNLLPMTVASFRRRWAEIEGEAMPVSRFDGALDKLKAGVVCAAEPLLEIACEMLRKDGPDE